MATILFWPQFVKMTFGIDTVEMFFMGEKKVTSISNNMYHIPNMKQFSWKFCIKWNSYFNQKQSKYSITKKAYYTLPHFRHFLIALDPYM